MFRQLSLLFVLCGCLVGCQSVPSFTKWRGHSEHRVSDDRPLINDLSMDDLREIEQELFLDAAQGKIGVDFDFNVNRTSVHPAGSVAMSDRALNELARMERHFLHEQIVATARGSQVAVRDESGGRYCGTLLRAGPDRIEMMNCISQEVIPGPDGQQQCKTSHIPFLTVETSAVTYFGMVAPPPPGFPATDEEIDGSEYSVAEIVNRSGQRQRWGKAPEAGHSTDDEAIATVP